MANLKISQLPTYTGDTAGFYIPVNNSGNTTTYKVSRETLLANKVVAAGNVGGSVDVDCSLGDIFTFTMTANTTPNFINFTDGQEITWVITNTNFDVPTATIAGGGDVYAKNGSINPSNNSKTLYYGTFVSGDLYIDEHTSFSAL